MTTKIVFQFIIILMCIGVFVWPGGSLSLTMVKGIEKRVPTVREYVFSAIPLLNLATCRDVLYAKKRGPIIATVLCVLTLAFRYFSYAFLSSDILISTISLISTWVVLAICYIYQAYVLIDMSICVQGGIVSKILAFLCPPASAYIIMQNVRKVAKDE